MARLIFRMKLSLLAPVLLIVLLGPAVAAAELLVTVGDVTATTALLWAQTSDPEPVGLRVEPAPEMRPTSISREVDGRALAVLRGLEPGRRYRYRVQSSGARAEGEFLTAPRPGDPVPVTLAWSGDLGSRGHCRSAEGWPAVDAIAERRPDLFVFAGDTIYADHRCGPDARAGSDFVATTLDGFRAKHRHNRADPAVQRLLRRTSVAAVWDDHDVRNNFAGPTERLTPVGLRAFLDYWPVAVPADEAPRLYRSLRWGQLLEIFILDTRSYRCRNRARDGPRKTMLGAAQRGWLIDSVTRSTATWKVIVSSVPLSIPKGWPFGDSWARRSVLGYVTGFSAERDAILGQLHARGVRRLVVLAADVHFGALMTHRPRPGFEVHELIAGPLAASTKDPVAPAEGLDTRVHFAHGGTPTFGELRADPARLTARLFDGRGRLLAEAGWSTP